MLETRIIPCLLLQEERLVKTIKFQNPIYVGDPINTIKIFNEKEVDELILIDINASKKNTLPNYSYIKQLAQECFMPLCYGGGIKSIQIADKLFEIGVEKLSIHSIIFDDFDLITQISNKYGSQSLVVSVDIKKDIFGRYKVVNSTNNNRYSFDIPVFLKKIQDAGAGEILINFVDRDGTKVGLNLDIIKQLIKNINIPIIICGGMNNLIEINKAVELGVSAVAAGAFFVFQGPHRAVLITYPSIDELVKHQIK
jgi:cyclase